MKNVLIVIFTIFTTFAFILLGIAYNLKSVVVDSIDVVVRDELVNGIVDYLGDNISVETEEIKAGIDDAIQNNPNIEKTIDNYFDMAMDILNGKEVADINLETELETLIDDNEEILKEHNITLTDEDKEKILSIASNQDINQKINDSISSIRSEMPDSFVTLLNIFNFAMSMTFKLILIAVAAVSLVLIALLKKSPYKWLTNFAWASILSGFTLSVLLTSLINIVTKNLDSNMITIPTSSISTYGYILIVAGVIAIILNIILSKIVKNKPVDEMNEETIEIEN